MSLILMGKATSGKDTVKNELVEKHGFHSIVTYTTRPMREGEIPDVTYHYISKDEFFEKIESGFFVEWKKYDVNGELWYYGSAKEDLLNADDNTVIILTPDGVRDVKKNGIKAIVIYLYANLTTIKKRLESRNDKNDKSENRIKRDIRDFKDADLLADRIVYNNLNDDIDKVVANVLFHYRKANNEK